MIVYGIETSCDDTGLAVLDISADGEVKILAELISSQEEIHREYGGIVPELASREHLKNLPFLHERLLEQAGCTLKDINCIGVTCGPGLKGCLLMGVSFASGLALAREIPVIGVNHIEGHLLAPMLDNPELEFPYLCLIVSGGHTEIHIVKGIGEYELLGRTIDDAAGEAFDKSAHLLGFDYPGGPALAKLADTCESTSHTLPVVMKGKKGFSFSGLKTAISRLVKQQQGERESLTAEEKGDIAYAVQEAIVKALMLKLKKALRETGISTVTISGGVSANQRLRREVQALKGCTAYFAEMKHCVDNGAMIGYTAGVRFLEGEKGWERPGVHARWPVETMRPVA
jgi:N6-L-threonylcarbamoyladenine synthase